MSSDIDDMGRISSGVLVESDVEEARLSDYLLFLGAVVISVALIGFGVMKLVEIL